MFCVTSMLSQVGGWCFMWRLCGLGVKMPTRNQNRRPFRFISLHQSAPLLSKYEMEVKINVQKILCSDVLWMTEQFEPWMTKWFVKNVIFCQEKPWRRSCVRSWRTWLPAGGFSVFGPNLNLRICRWIRYRTCFWSRKVRQDVRWINPRSCYLRRL